MLRMDIHYSTRDPITAEQFIGLLQRTSLGARRPLDDPDCVSSMLQNADILCTAWAGTELVGVARSVTDYSYCCYLSDLAVDEALQGQGIGKQLIRLTQGLLGKEATLILLAAPQAESYYPAVGFRQHHSAWVTGSRDPIR